MNPHFHIARTVGRIALKFGVWLSLSAKNFIKVSMRDKFSHAHCAPSFPLSARPFIAEYVASLFRTGLQQLFQENKGGRKIAALKKVAGLFLLQWINGIRKYIPSLLSISLVNSQNNTVK